MAAALRARGVQRLPQHTHADSARAASSKTAAPTCRLYVVSNLAARSSLAAAPRISSAASITLRRSSPRIARGPVDRSSLPSDRPCFRSKARQESRGTQDAGRARRSVMLSATSVSRLDARGSTIGREEHRCSPSLGKSARASDARGQHRRRHKRHAARCRRHCGGDCRSQCSACGGRSSGRAHMSRFGRVNEGCGRRSQIRTGSEGDWLGLAAVPRGEALRLAETVPDLTVLVVGKPSTAARQRRAAPAGAHRSTWSSEPRTICRPSAWWICSFRTATSIFRMRTGVANAEALASLDKRIRDSRPG